MVPSNILRSLYKHPQSRRNSKRFRCSNLLSFKPNSPGERMSPYFNLCTKLTIRSKEYSIYCKRDARHGAIFKIAEMIGLPDGRVIVNKIFVTLDVATELCERLNALEQLYRESRPLPRNGQLHFEEMIEEESTLKLDLSVREYRQNLQITQSKKIMTRGPCDSLNIPDVGEFRRALYQLVEDFANNTLTLSIETDDSGISKVIRGDRVAVIYCPIRPWPWTRSYPIKELLFDPTLVGLILFDRDVDKIREYCERTYPNLMVDSYVDMDFEQNDWTAVLFENLKIRWIRRGQQFRINEHPGTLSLKQEDHWFTA
uniref:Uncharacterized protein n=1 Tax=Daphnia galeata TaxID=27404 RepID=A0A8J2RMU1_9CRUS|nr:unnamed protein product [Daphnia galeata]